MHGFWEVQTEIRPLVTVNQTHPSLFSWTHTKSVWSKSYPPTTTKSLDSHLGGYWSRTSAFSERTYKVRQMLDAWSNCFIVHYIYRLYIYKVKGGYVFLHKFFYLTFIYDAVLKLKRLGLSSSFFCFSLLSSYWKIWLVMFILDTKALCL